MSFNLYGLNDLKNSLFPVRVEKNDDGAKGKYLFPDFLANFKIKIVKKYILHAF